MDDDKRAFLVLSLFSKVHRCSCGRCLTLQTQDFQDVAVLTSRQCECGKYLVLRPGAIDAHKPLH